MRTPSHLFLTPFLLGLAWAPRLDAAPADIAGGRARVMVLNRIELATNLGSARAKLVTALADAISQRGYELVAAPPTTCLDAECLRALAGKVGATDVLIATGGPTELYGYAVNLRLWSATSEHEERSTASCNTCTAAQMVDILTPSAGALLDRIPALNARVEAPAITMPPSSPSPVPLVASAPPPAPDRKVSPERVALGAGLLAAGGVSLGFGISLLASNGGQTGCLAGRICNHTNQNSTFGTVLTVGGGVLAAAGATVLLFFRNQPLVSVAIGPAGLSIGGTY